MSSNQSEHDSTNVSGVTALDISKIRLKVACERDRGHSFCLIFIKFGV